MFPLPGALLLPRGQMPLNIFEPRYLAMVDDSLRDGHRLIGMIQPDAGASRSRGQAQSCSRSAASAASPRSPRPATAAICMQLTGVARFRVEEELKVATAYRQCRVSYLPFADDFIARKGEDEVDRKALLEALSGVSQGQQSQDRLGGHRERAERGAGQRAGDDVALWRRRRSRRCWRRPT